MDNGLAAHIRKFAPLTDEDASLLNSYARPLVIKKRVLLLQEGQVCRENYFVEKGCLRMFFTDDKGAEQTVQFAIENWWITDYGSYAGGSPSQFFIQAVENSTILAFSRSSQEELFTALPVLERYFRRILERAFGATQWRIRYIFSQSKEERYRHFTGLYPEFIQRIPQYMLASYLGLTPEYLSEIRNKKL